MAIQIIGIEKQVFHSFSPFSTTYLFLSLNYCFESFLILKSGALTSYIKTGL